MKITACIPKYNNYALEAQATDTILNLKTNLLKILNIQTDSKNAEKILIIYKNIICKDHQTLTSLNITDNSMVYANFPDLLRSKINSAPQNLDSSNQLRFTVNSNLECFSIQNLPQAEISYTHQSFIDNKSTSNSSPNDLSFTFPDIKTNQKIYTSSQEQTQNTITTGDPLSNPIVVPNDEPFPSSPMEFGNYSSSDYENNVNLLVSLGYKERSVRNMLRLTSNNFYIARLALEKGALQDDESNKLAESLSTTSSSEKRREILDGLLKNLIYNNYSNLSQEDKKHALDDANKKLDYIRESCHRMGGAQGYPQYQMIQQSRLTQSERDILPLLRNAVNGIGGYSNDNPFDVYLNDHDDTSFVDLNGNQSEELFNQFSSACTLETEQWKFVARSMLSGHPLSECLFYLESAEYDPATAALLMKDTQ